MPKNDEIKVGDTVRRFQNSEGLSDSVLSFRVGKEGKATSVTEVYIKVNGSSSCIIVDFEKVEETPTAEDLQQQLNTIQDQITNLAEKDEFDYPLYKKNVNCGCVFKYTNLTDNECVDACKGIPRSYADTHTSKNLKDCERPNTWCEDDIQRGVTARDSMTNWVIAPRNCSTGAYNLITEGEIIKFTNFKTEEEMAEYLNQHNYTKQ